jgi:hypothetical protein
MSNDPLSYLTDRINPSTGLESDPLKQFTSNIRNLQRNGPDDIFRPSNLTDSAESFYPYLGKRFNPLNDIEEQRAQSQSATERVTKAMGRFFPGVLGKTIQSLGNVAGLIPAAAYGDINLMIDNPIVNLGRMIEEETDAALPIYHRDIYTNGGFLDKIGTSEFWTEDAADGLEFLTSAYLSSALIAKGVQGAFKLSKLKGNLTAMNKMAKTRHVDDILKGGQKVNPQRFMDNADFALTTAFNTVGEAGIEARELRDQLIDQGVDFETASKTAAKTAQANVAALLLSNAWQTRLFKGSAITKKGRLDEVQKRINIAKGRPIGANITVKEAEEGLKGLKKSFGKEFFKKQAPITMLSEGAWEENVQTAIQKVFEHNAVNDPDNFNKRSIIDFIPQIANQMSKNWGETEGQTAIGLGMFLGLIGAAGSSYRDVKQNEAINSQVSKAIGVGNIANMANMASFHNTVKNEETGKTEIELDENGRPVFDAIKSAELGIQLLEDKSLFDELMRSKFAEDEIGSKMISAIALARDFYRHAGSEEDVEFYNAKMDMFSIAEDEDGFMKELSDFQSKYQSKLSKLKEVSGNMAKPKGLSEQAFNKLKSAIYMQGAYQMVIDELIEEQNTAKEDITGTGFDLKMQKEQDRRLEFLAKIKEDNENLFEKLTDGKLMTQMDEEGLFENKHYDKIVKKLGAKRKLYNSATDETEKKVLEKEVKELNELAYYAKLKEEAKYGRVFDQFLDDNQKLQQGTKPRNPFDVPITRDEMGRAFGTGAPVLSRAEKTFLDMSDSVASKQELKNILNSVDESEDATAIEQVRALTKALNDLQGFTSNRNFSYLGDSTDMYVQSIRELVNNAKSIQAGIQQMRGKLGALMNELQAGSPQEINPTVEDLTGYTQDAQGTLINSKQENSVEFTKYFSSDPQAIAALIFENQGKPVEEWGEGNGNTLFSDIVQDLNKQLITIEDSIPDNVEGRIANAQTKLIDKVDNANKMSEFYQRLINNGVYEYDNYVDYVVGDEIAESHEEMIEEYLNPTTLVASSSLELAMREVTGAISYYKDRLEMESSNKKDTKELLKRFQALLPKYDKALEVVLEKERNNKQRLQRIKLDIAKEGWTGLGRNEKGEVVDDEIDQWLKDNLKGYDELIAKAEKDKWNPIYTEYIFSEINVQGKVAAFKAMMDPKILKETKKAIQEIKDIGTEEAGTEYTGNSFTRIRQLLKAYRKNPRASLYSIFKNTDFFNLAYTAIDHPTVTNYLTSNDVNDFDIGKNGKDIRLAQLVQAHNKAVAYKEAIDRASSNMELQTRVEIEKNMFNLLQEGEFAPTPSQVSAIRSFFSFFSTGNKKGLFGNTSVLGGVTGAGKTQVFIKHAIEILGLDESDFIAFGHTGSSTITINNEIGGLNKTNNTITQFIPETVLQGNRLIDREQAAIIAEEIFNKEYSDTIKLFIIDEGFALPGSAIHALGLITEAYNEINGSKENGNNEAKLLILGDPSQLTLSSLDGIADFAFSTELLDPNMQEEVSTGMSNLTYLPFLPINYRSNNFAISNAQAQFIGKIELPERLQFFANEEFGTTKNPVGVHSISSVDNVLQHAVNNQGNGRTKLIVVPNMEAKQYVLSSLGEERMETKIEKDKPEYVVQTALDAQGMTTDEVYIMVLPTDSVNSENYRELRVIQEEKDIFVSKDVIENRIVSQDYNTLMYMLIGRAEYYVAVVANTKDGEFAKQKESPEAETDIKQFEVNSEQNKKEYGKQLDEELRILSDLTGKEIQVTPKKEDDDTEDEDDNDDNDDDDDGDDDGGTGTAITDEVIVDGNINEGDEIPDGTFLVAQPEDISKDEEDDAVEFDNVTNEEGQKPYAPDNEDEDSSSSSNEPPFKGIEIKEEDLENIKIAHPKSKGLRSLKNVLEVPTLAGKTVYFAKINRTRNKDGKRTPFAIKLFYSKENDGMGIPTNFIEIGEISGKQFDSAFGQNLNNQLNNIPGRVDTKTGVYKLNGKEVLPAVITAERTASVTYSETYTAKRPASAIKRTIAMAQDTFFNRENTSGNTELKIEFVVAQGALLTTHPAFIKMKELPQLGAVYMYLNNGSSGLRIRMSALPLKESNQYVKSLNSFISKVELLSKNSGIEIDIASSEFSKLLSSVTDTFINKKIPKRGSAPLTYKLRSRRGNYRDHINESLLLGTPFSKEFVLDNLKTIRDIYLLTHRTKFKKTTVSKEEYDTKWKDQKYKFETAPNNEFYLVTPDGDNMYEYSRGYLGSPVAKALYSLVITNQFKKEGRRGANDAIKAMRYDLTEGKKEANILYKSFNKSGLNPKSALESKYAERFYNIIRARLTRIRKLHDPSFPNYSNDNINEENYKRYIDIIERYANKNPSVPKAKIYLAQVKEYEQDQENHTPLTIQDIKNLLQFKDGQSDFGDGTYLRSPVYLSTVSKWNRESTEGFNGKVPTANSTESEKKEFNEFIKKVSPYISSKVSEVIPTELSVKLEGQEVRIKTQEVPKTQKEDDISEGDLNDIYSLDFGELQTDKRVTVEKAKEIAKSLIPNINEAQLEFIELHLLQKRKNSKRADTLLGQMSNKSVALGIVEGTEKDPEVYEEVVYHELMHLLWNYYIKPSTKRAVEKWIKATYPETRSMNHIDLDEFIAERFQAYTPTKPRNLLEKWFNNVISFLNLLFNRKKSLYSLFDSIHEGKYDGSIDYSSREFKDTVRGLETKVETKIKELQTEDDIIKECNGARGKRIKAKDGLSNGLTEGGKWRIIKDFKGKSHEQGGIDIMIGKGGIKMSGNGGNIKAKNGLFLKSNRFDDPAKSAMAKVISQRNKNIPWVDRGLNPDKYPTVKNSDGSESTHRMAAEIDEKGDWYSFPTLDRKDGGWVDFGDDNYAAFDYAKENGTAIKMPSKDMALYYSTNGLIKH